MDDNIRQFLIADAPIIAGGLIAWYGIYSGHQAEQRGVARQESDRALAWRREDRWRWAAEKRGLYARFLGTAAHLRRVAYDVHLEGITEDGPESAAWLQSLSPDFLALRAEIRLLAEPLTTRASDLLLERTVALLATAAGSAEPENTFDEALELYDFAAGAFTDIARHELLGLDLSIELDDPAPTPAEGQA
ncbi:MAG TPA: hypothetical protein VKR24_07945 [Candidatus Limnocylindrales bacterium]|nr:hypothetical protein [Candidatus Limnocylindrales bacterium]